MPHLRLHQPSLVMRCHQVRWVIKKHAALEADPADLTVTIKAYIASLYSQLDTDNSGDVDRVEWITFITQQARIHGERPMLKLMQVLGKQLDQLWTP